MSGVGKVGRAGGVAAGGVRRLASGGGFSVAAADGAASAAPAAAVAPLSLDALLALQQMPAEAVRDREAKRHGEAMLRLLGALQHTALGGGGDDAALLAELGGLAEGVPEAEDPRLRSAVAAVALRARIELARRA